jgi:preprotein translocase subunit Sss1
VVARRRAPAVTKEYCMIAVVGGGGGGVLGLCGFVLVCMCEVGDRLAIQGL